MKRFVLAALLFVLLSTAVLAASGSADKTEPDARLDRKVTIKAIGKPLGDFLKELTAQTGVKMTARRDAADIKVAVFVKDTPLSSLKDALKDCLHLQCTREGKAGEWTYSFWEDLKTRQDAARIRQEEVKQLRTCVDNLVKELAEIEAEGKDPTALRREISAMTAEQRDKLMRDDPDRYMAWLAFASEGTLPTVTAYSGLGRAQVQALWAGQKTTIRTAEMPPELSRKFESRTAEWTRKMHEHDWKFPQQQEPIYTDDIGGIVLELVDSEWNNKPCLRYSFQHEMVDGSGLVTGSSSGFTVPEQEGPSDGTASQADNAAENADPRPDIELKFDPETNMYSIMEQVHDLTGTCIVADYYTRMARMAVLYNRAPRKTADDVLRQLAKDAHSITAKSGDVRVFSSRMWPADRDREIPERLLAGWRAARKQYGGFRLGEAFQMANLSRLQLEDLELYKTGRGWAIIDSQSAIRVAGSLTGGQWQAAMSEAGLPASEMNAAQLALIQAWARQSEGYMDSPRLSEELSDPARLRSCALKIRCTGCDKKDGAIAACWEFELYLPSYYEAIRKAAASTANNGEEVSGMPTGKCTGRLHLPSLQDRD